VAIVNRDLSAAGVVSLMAVPEAVTMAVLEHLTAVSNGPIDCFNTQPVDDAVTVRGTGAGTPSRCSCTSHPMTPHTTSDTCWFHEARFGLFVHWGLYALRSSTGAEWAIYRESISKEAYRKYLNHFTADRFDPDAWMSLARRAGMRYVVVTAKHHDGFCLFPTETSDWHIGKTPFGKDAIRLLADAARRAGLRFGVYFSVWDMWQPGLDGGLNAIGAEGELQGKADKAAWSPSPEGIAIMHRQVEELMTGYGTIDILWFDVRRAPGHWL
jgi:alpha-L-fucosidase